MGGSRPVLHEKSPVEKWLEWAKAHQEFIAVTGIVVLLLAIGIPYVIHSRAQSEKDAQGVLSLGQYYLHSPVDPKNGPFKSNVERLQQSLQTFQRILTDYSGTQTAKLARYYVAKCEYSLGQYTQAYSNFDTSTQELKGIPLGQEAYLGKILCLEAQNEYPQAATWAETFLKEYPNSFLAGEVRLDLSDVYLKTNNKTGAVEQLKILVQSDADDDWGREAERRLKEMQS